MTDSRKAWEIHEENCFNYLIENFGDNAEFHLHLGADSTTSDIEVTTPSQQFYIEVKLSPAQCGQFVLLDNGEEFQYSQRNKTPYNKQTGIIIDYMNQHIEDFRAAGTRGQKIELPEKILSQWVQETYAARNVEFFITNEFNIVPIEDFDQHFNVTATYRAKRSGSSRVAKGRIAEVVYYLAESDDFEYFTEDDRGALFVKTVPPEGSRFTLNDRTYMLAPRGEEYEVRQLSNTNNSNVIFSLKYNGVPGISAHQFTEFLRS